MKYIGIANRVSGGAQKVVIPRKRLTRYRRIVHTQVPGIAACDSMLQAEVLDGPDKGPLVVPGDGLSNFLIDCGALHRVEVRIDHRPISIFSPRGYTGIDRG